MVCSGTTEYFSNSSGLTVFCNFRAKSFRFFSEGRSPLLPPPRRTWVLRAYLSPIRIACCSGKEDFFKDLLMDEIHSGTAYEFTCLFFTHNVRYDAIIKFTRTLISYWKQPTCINSKFSIKYCTITSPSWTIKTTTSEHGLPQCCFTFLC